MAALDYSSLYLSSRLRAAIMHTRPINKYTLIGLNLKMVGFEIILLAVCFAVIAA